MSRILHLDLGERSYPIYIGEALLDDTTLYRRHVRSRQVMLVTNETVAPLYLERVEVALAGFHTRSVILPDGEAYKTLEVWNRIFDALLAQRFDRR